MLMFLALVLLIGVQVCNGPQIPNADLWKNTAWGVVA